MLFENNNFDYDVLSLAGLNFDNYPMYNSNRDMLVNTKEGFLRGNMFDNLYVPYKNMNVRQIKPMNEREVLLYKIMEIDFAINDLNLYLDLNPEDMNMYEKFKMYNKECFRLKDEYAKKYGPLTLDQVDSKNYEWMKNPWPWENNGGSM